MNPTMFKVSHIVIGQTNRRVNNLIYEHDLAVFKANPTSVLHKHYTDREHMIDFIIPKTIWREISKIGSKFYLRTS